MAMLEIFAALFDANFSFLIDLIKNNLFWVFGFLAAGYYFTNGKHSIRNALVYFGLVLGSMDLFRLTGFSIYTAFGLGVLYLIRVPLLLFLENIKGGSKYLAIVWVLSFFFVIALVAFVG